MRPIRPIIPISKKPNPPPSMTPNLDQLKEVLAAARQEVAKVIIGQRDVIDKRAHPHFHRPATP